MFTWPGRCRGDWQSPEYGTSASTTGISPSFEGKHYLCPRAGGRKLIASGYLEREVGLVASGHSIADILKSYPYLEEEDVREALAYAAWRSEEMEVPLATY